MQNAVDLEQRLQSLSGVEFEKVCGQLVSSMGFAIEYTKASGDGGIDIIAYNSAPLLKGKYIIQCKRYLGNVGEPIIRDLVGVVTKNRANKGILITTGGFSAHAKEFAANLPIELIDGTSLIELLNEHQIGVHQIGSDYNTDPILDVLSRFTFKEAYLGYKHRCVKESNSISSIGALANYLFAQALSSAYGTNNGPTLTERIVLLEQVKRILQPLESGMPHCEKNKNDSVKLCVCQLIMAQTYFLLGDFQKAKQLYQHLLEWKDLTHSLKLHNGLVDMLWNVVFDMCSFYSCIGQKSVCSQWLENQTISELRYMKRAILLSKQQNQTEIYPFSSKDAYVEYYQRELYDLDNVITDPCFHPVELMDDFFFSESLYDPIEEQYVVPFDIIRFHFFNGDYKVKDIGKKRPDVLFVYTTENGSRALELIVSG